MSGGLRGSGQRDGRILTDISTGLERNRLPEKLHAVRELCPEWSKFTPTLQGAREGPSENTGLIGSEGEQSGCVFLKGSSRAVSAQPKGAMG